MFWHVITCTGWTWEEVGENMDLKKLKSMNEYQRKFPPTHVMIANYLNMGDRSSKAPAEDPEVNKESDIAELMVIFPGT